MPAMCWAAIKDHDILVRFLLDRGFSTAVQAEDGLTPLSLAVQCGSEKTARLLLDHNADMEVFDRRDKTPLIYAAYSGYDNLVKLLLDRGADRTIPEDGINTQNALHVAAGAGRRDTVELLLDEGFDIGCRDGFERTPLHLVVDKARNSWTHFAVARMLLERGADVNARDINRETPLLRIAKWNFGAISVCQLLLDHGADINARGSILWSGTALDKALGAGCQELIDLIRRNGGVTSRES